MRKNKGVEPQLGCGGGEGGEAVATDLLEVLLMYSW